ARRDRHSRARSDRVDHQEPGQGARHSRPDRYARARQAGGRGDLEQGSVLDLRPDPEGLHRRGAGLRPPRPEVPTQVRLHARPARGRNPLMRRNRLKLAACAAALGFAAPVSAETVAIVGGHIYTVGAAGEIGSGTLLIKDGKIAAVGPDVKIPAGAKVI